MLPDLKPYLMWKLTFLLSRDISRVCSGAVAVWFSTYSSEVGGEGIVGKVTVNILERARNN